MSNLNLAHFLKAKDDLTVIYIVRNTPTKNKLEEFLNKTGIDPIRKVVVDSRLEVLKNGKNLIRIEAPAFKEKRHG